MLPTHPNDSGRCHRPASTIDNASTMEVEVEVEVKAEVEVAVAAEVDKV